MIGKPSEIMGPHTLDRALSGEGGGMSREVDVAPWGDSYLTQCGITKQVSRTLSQSPDMVITFILLVSRI
jgi:hypothetical protein